MRNLKGKEADEAMDHLRHAQRCAISSTCLRARCGSVIVKSGKVIGRGHNSPPFGNKITECIKDKLPENFKSDRTCCVHAEQRAIMDALRFSNDLLEIYNSTLYFVRLDENCNIEPAGHPYCTICSKLILDVGITKVVLYQKDGIYEYGADEYNRISFEYKPKND